MSNDLFIIVTLDGVRLKATECPYPQTLLSLRDYARQVIRSKSNLSDAEIDDISMSFGRFLPQHNDYVDIDSDDEIRSGSKILVEAAKPLRVQVEPLDEENMETVEHVIHYETHSPVPTLPATSPQPQGHPTETESASGTELNSLSKHGCTIASVPKNKQKFVFEDTKAWDVDAILDGCHESDRSLIRKRFTESNLSKPSFDEARRLLVSVCGNHLLHKVYESGRDKPTAAEKARMAFSVWMRFPFYRPSIMVDGGFPYAKLYDPIKNSGYIETFICNKVRNAKNRAEKRQPSDSSSSQSSAKSPRKSKQVQESRSVMDKDLAEMKLKQLSSLAPDGNPISRQQVIDLMAELFPNRRQWIETDDSVNVGTILKTYPCLATMPELMMSEFDKIAREAGIDLPNMDERWLGVADFIIEQQMSLKKYSQMQQNILAGFDATTLDEARELSPEKRASLGLQFLPVLLPPLHTGKDNKEMVPIAQAITHLIQYRKVPVNQSVRSVIDMAKNDKTLTQPFLIAFTPYGTQGELATQLFVVVDYTPIEVPEASFVKALKYLFASFFVFNTDYPRKSLCLVYQFLELLFGFGQKPTGFRQKLYKNKGKGSTRTLDLFDRAMHFIANRETMASD